MYHGLTQRTREILDFLVDISNIGFDGFLHLREVVERNEANIALDHEFAWNLVDGADRIADFGGFHRRAAEEVVAFLNDNDEYRKRRTMST